MQLSFRMKYLLIPLILLIFLDLFPKVGDTQISMPWDEFKSMTNIDKDMIVIPTETFEKLIRQTGEEVMGSYNKVNGNVVLTLSEFKKIVGKMKAPGGPDIDPPYDYLVTRSVYSGKMQEENTSFSASFFVHVLQDKEYLKIPVVPSTTAVENIRVNGDPALIVSEDGYIKVILKGSGEYKVSADFSVKSSLKKGPHELYMYINKTPVTLFELEIPQPEIDVEIPQANSITIDDRKNSTHISAVITSSSNITVKWRKRFEIKEKLPPKVYADMNHLISIQDNTLKTTTEIKYNILHSEVEEVAVSIDDNVNILNVYGSAIGEWQEINKDDVRMIHIPFTYGKKGNVSVTVVTETPLSPEGLGTAFNGISSLNTIRETGNIGIELNTSAEVIVTENKGLERIAVQTLPPALLNKSAKPLIEGFKYSKHPFQLMLDIKKHRKIGVPMAAVYSANIVTLFTEDGKIVHKLQYKIKNSSKQFLEIKLPENADVFSVFVNDNPVESSLNDTGKLLVPLIRSNSLNSSSDTFPVEVIYAVSRDNFSFYGIRTAGLPAVDLFTSQIMWSVYLPNDYRYIYFDSTLEKEELIRGINIFKDGRTYQAAEKTDGFKMDYDTPQTDKSGSAISRQKSKKLSSFRNNAIAKEEQLMQVEAEMDFGREMKDLAEAPSISQHSSSGTGLMPIRIKIPTTGQVYRFAKTIVNPEDPLTFKVWYVQSWVPGAVRAVLWIIVILILFLLRNKFVKLFKFIVSKFKKNKEEGETFFFDEKGKADPGKTSYKDDGTSDTENDKDKKIDN